MIAYALLGAATVCLGAACAILAVELRRVRRAARDAREELTRVVYCQALATALTPGPQKRGKA